MWKTSNFCGNSSRKREVAIQNELEELDFKICNSANMDLDSQILDKYESAKTELKNCTI